MRPCKHYNLDDPLAISRILENFLKSSGVRL